VTLPFLDLWLHEALGPDDESGAANPRPWHVDRGEEDAGATLQRSRSQVPGLTDQEIVAHIRNGDEAVFSAMWRAYWIPLTQLALFHVHDRDVAEDLVAELLGGIWQRREVWKVRGSLTAYLVVAIRHRAMNVVRSDRRRTSAHQRQGDDVAIHATSNTSGAPDDVELDAPRIRARISEAVRRLPERYRTILLLRWRFQDSWQDVAMSLEISVSAAKVQHHRALRMLRDYLGADFL